MRHFNLIFNFLIGMGILLGCNSCTFHRLSVQTQYLGHEDLASYHVGTPDPHLNDSVIGQRLLIQWSLCAKEIEGKDVILYLKVRFRNRQEQEIQIPIVSKKGTYLYLLMNEDYCQSGGILTYYVEIRNKSSVLALWKHSLWVPLIHFDDLDLENQCQNNQEFHNFINLKGS